MNPPTKTHATPSHAPAHNTHTEPEEPDDPAPWNPGKPLSDLITFMDFGD